MNRTPVKLVLFEDQGDYAAFERVLAEALVRFAGHVELLAYCLMPNHFHLVLLTRSDGELSRFMQWLTMTHAQRWHAHRHTGGRGHLYQSRFRSFAVQRDQWVLSVCRYVERNALRANLVRRAQDWRWCSLAVRAIILEQNRRDHGGGNGDDDVDHCDPRHPLTDLLSRRWPVTTMPRADAWLELVNRPQDEQELAALRRSRDRGSPYGTSVWTTRTAKRLGIESSLRPVGRPPKAKPPQPKPAVTRGQKRRKGL
jgi:putative transposase